MKRIMTFEQFEINTEEELLEEVKLFGKEIKLWPSYNDILRKHLSFLNNYDLDKLTAGGNQKEIKDIMKKVDKATKTTERSLIKDIDNASVHEVQTMLKTLKKLKSDIEDEDAIIGYVSYYPELKDFAYNPGFEMQKK